MHADLDAEFKFDAEEDVPDDNVFMTVADPFLSFFESSRFSDCELVFPDGSVQPAHRLVLAYCSRWFSTELENSGADLPALNEQPSLRITLPDVDDTKMLPLVLKWMYTGRLTLTSQNCVVVSVLAERFQIPLLQRTCRAYISANLQRENALDILLEAIKFKTEKVIDRCISTVARNFQHLQSDSFHCLPAEIFARVLQHRKLAVSSGEFPLFRAVSSYVSHHQLSESQVFILMSNVRFRFMTFEELEEVSRASPTNPVVICV